MSLPVADIRDKIMLHLQRPDINRNLSWLSGQTGISRSHLFRIFVSRERTLTEANRKKINEVLKTKFK